jgi:hypothetical protein
MPDLALDASTPVAVTTNVASTGTRTLTTASFTPPVGAILVLEFNTNSLNSSNVLSNFQATDNLGTHLTYTQIQQVGNLNNDVQVTLWKSSPVLSSVAMTVSASYTEASAGTYPDMLRVLVFTGADTSSPIGAHGGARGQTTRINVSYVSTRSGSWGWLGYSDWTQSGIPTVTGAESVDASYEVASQDSYAVIKQNALTTSIGTTVTMSTATPVSALQVSYLYFEVVPALVGPTTGSVPSGTAQTAGALSAKFLFFDTGDYSPGL